MKDLAMQVSEFQTGLKYILTCIILEEQNEIQSSSEDHFSCNILQTKKSASKN